MKNTGTMAADKDPTGVVTDLAAQEVWGRVGTLRDWEGEEPLQKVPPPASHTAFLLP